MLTVGPADCRRLCIPLVARGALGLALFIWSYARFGVEFHDSILAVRSEVAVRTSEICLDEHPPTLGTR